MKDSMSLVDIKISRTRKRWLARSLKIIHRAPWGCGADTLHPSLQVSTLSFHWGLGQLPVVFTVFDIRLAVGLRTVQYVLRNARLFPAALKSRSQLRSNFVRWVQFSPICLRYCLLQRHCNASSDPSDLLWQSLTRLGNVTFSKVPNKCSLFPLYYHFTVNSAQHKEIDRSCETDPQGKMFC